MPEKISIQLGDVQRTLLIPLFGRAKEFEKEHPLIKDKYAHEIVGKLDYDFKAGFEKMPMQFLINTAIRAYHLDTALLKVMAEHPDATIISIGSGLDTTFTISTCRIPWNCGESSSPKALGINSSQNPCSTGVGLRTSRRGAQRCFLYRAAFSFI
jgi:O-methyltransferase involved in polyketide biosynthesis